MSVPSVETKKEIVVMSEEDRKTLAAVYDKDHDGQFSNDEIEDLVKAYNTKTIADPQVLAIMKRYDTNSNGNIDHLELAELKHHMSLGDTAARYAAYSAGFARAFRYLAFTSDFGEALRPVVSARIVGGSYAIALGYCVVDVGYEAYKLKERGYVTEKNHHMTMTQCIVERATFQAVASVAVPFAIIHTTVDISRKICNKMNRFKRWGPSIAGLSIVPLLPLYLDEPVEHAIEWAFEKFGPWGKPKEAGGHGSAAEIAAHAKKD